MNAPLDYVGALMGRVSVVDAFGALKAQIADLEKQAAALRAEIIAMGLGAHEGDLFRATVSVTERETLDMDAVRAHLSRQFIQAHTKVTEVTMVRAVARTGKAA